MNLRQQLIIDKTIVKFAVLALNVVVRILGKLLRINHKLDSEFKVFAICKFKGLGSIIQATPLIQTIRVNYPEAKIIFVTTESNRMLVQAYPEIDEVITLNDSSTGKLVFGFIPFVWSLLRSNIDNYFDLEIYSNFSSLVTTLSMATNRFGYYLRSSHYRLGIYTHMMFYNIDSPIFQTYLQLIRAFPIQKEITNLKAPEFKKSNWLETFNLTENQYIVINPNASDLRLERRWGSENFITLIPQISKQFSELKVVLIGAPAEANYVKELVAKLPSGNVIDTAGKTSLTGLFEIIKNSKLVITNDSGPMHIAFAFQKMTIGLFGPCSPEQYGFHEFAIPVYKKIYCSPCVHEFDISPCNGNNQCMQLIEVSEVLGHVKTVLEGNFKPNVPESELFFHGKNEWVPGFVNR
jgi:ADP-heptose:LPS heptosyltransferase